MLNTNEPEQKTNNIFGLLLLSAFVVFIGLVIYLKYEQSFAEDKIVTVYKSPTCDCCNKWIDHLENNGLKVKAVDMNNMAKIKEMAKIPAGAGSCHTAFIDNYAIEGHVPAKDIKQLLVEKRNVAGLTVPGMPMGSPGMEGHRVDNYSVFEFNNQGKLKEVSRY